MNEISPPAPGDSSALIARLAELRGVADDLAHDLPTINDPALRPAAAALVDSVRALVSAHGAEPSEDLAEALNALMDAVCKLDAPARDTQMDAATPTLRRVREAKGLIVISLMECLNAARTLGWVPKTPTLLPTAIAPVPKGEIGTPLLHIERSYAALADRVDQLERVTQAPHVTVLQIGIVNSFVRNMRMELKLRKLELNLGDLVDLPALWRIAERIWERTTAFRAKARALLGQISDAAVEIAESLPRLARRAAAGVAAAARWVTRKRQRVEAQRDLAEADDNHVGPFDLNEAARMILSGRAPPASWRMLITNLHSEALHELKDLTPLAELRALQQLEVTSSPANDLTPISRLTSLRHLTLASMQELSDISPLTGLVALEHLNLAAVPKVSDLRPLKNLTALRSLNLFNTAVVDISPIEHCKQLQVLNLSNTGVADLSSLAGLSRLRVLALSGTRVMDLSSIAGLTALHALHLENTGIKEIYALAYLNALETLDLSETAVRDLRPLAGLPVLKDLNLAETPVVDIAPLSELPALQTLSLFKMGQVKDLMPLARLPALQRIHLGGAVLPEARAQLNARREALGLPIVQFD